MFTGEERADETQEPDVQDLKDESIAQRNLDFSCGWPSPIG